MLCTQSINLCFLTSPDLVLHLRKSTKKFIGIANKSENRKRGKKSEVTKSHYYVLAYGV